MEDKPIFFLGIDPSQRYQPYVYVALDEKLRIQAIGDGPLREILAFLAGLGTACVAINGPQMVNQGLADQDEHSNRLFSVPVSNSRDLRQVEQFLLHEGVDIYRTPASESDCMVWVRRSFKLFKRIPTLDFLPFQEGQKRQFVEAPAEAIFSRLIGGNPLFDSLTLEGRIQRQLILFDQGLGVMDAMNFFEEVTRFRLMKGILPTKDIHHPGELNALACAYLAWMLFHKPEQTQLLGDIQEGVVFLPIKKDDTARIRM